MNALLRKDADQIIKESIAARRGRTPYAQGL